MGSTGPERDCAALCTPFPPAAPEIKTVLATVPDDLEEQWFDDSHLPKVL